MFRIEIVDKEENLLESEDFREYSEMMIKYNRIMRNLNTRKDLNNTIIMLFEGQDEENLHEITKHRTIL